uniref:Uncharacterized protein n=1 Tax=Alexandrium andersonii TaxID=327968 RepID=A0A7S2ASY4_9DINO|mmetsp:Transcript_17719/g.40013  ORF Transcript_17719/g.40013 Transcript_17719/m.40013 type:complete len:245 (+) Transcript_17719:81-815(+)
MGRSRSREKDRDRRRDKEKDGKEKDKEKKRSRSRDRRRDEKKKSRSREKEKEKKEKEPAAKSKVGDAEKAKLAANALKEIFTGIAKPDAQKGGNFFIPQDWHLRYKDALGPYKKFVQSCEELALHEIGNGSFKVTKKGDACPETSPAKQEQWKKQLDSAWQTYCKVTPTHERSLKNFTSVLPTGAEKTKADAPKQAQADAPKAEEKKAEEASEGAGTGSQKRKAAEEPKEGGGKTLKKKAKKKP